MTYDKTIHLRVSDQQLKFIDSVCKKKGVNKSEVIRTILDKAMKKNGHKKK